MSIRKQRLWLIAMLTAGLCLAVNSGLQAGDMAWYALGYREDSAGVNQVAVTVGLTYASVGKQDLHLDVYQPYKPQDIRPPYPGVVLLHSGAVWFADSRTLSGYARFLASRGFVAITVEYRHGNKASWPACLNDVKTALRWLRANADRFQIDQKHLAVVGDAAGGQLAALAGLAGPSAGFEGANDGNANVSSAVQAVVAYYGIFDPAQMGSGTASGSPITWLLGAGSAKDANCLAQASPVKYISRKSPPFLLIHGVQDKIVPAEQSKHMADLLLQAGAECELILVNNAGFKLKGFKGKPQPTLIEIDAKVIEFLQKYLR